MVRLSDEKRGACQENVKRLKWTIGKSEKVKRARILLKADDDGPVVRREDRGGVLFSPGWVLSDPFSLLHSSDSLRQEMQKILRVIMGGVILHLGLGWALINA